MSYKIAKEFIKSLRALIDQFEKMLDENAEREIRSGKSIS